MKRTRCNRTSNPKPARPGWTHVLLLLIIALAACGTTLVNIRVDIGSFLSDEELSIDYGSDPVIPGDGPTVTIRTPVEIIPMAEEINQVTDIDAIEIRTLVEFRNDTGAAVLFYRVYFNSTVDNIFDSEPVIDERVELDSRTTTRSEILIDGDTRLTSMFEGDEIAVATEIRVIPGGGGEDIAGVVELMELTVQITAVGETE